MKLRVLELCKSKDLKLEQLSDMLGISNVGLSQQINGNPTIKTLQKIATALEVTVPELFEQPKNNIINCPHCGGKIKVSKE